MSKKTHTHSFSQQDIKIMEEDPDQKRSNTSYQRSPKTGEESLIQRIEQLEHELAYTRQEVEFLKKIQEAGMEEQKVWESKRLRK